jgi:hypothetical protein
MRAKEFIVERKFKDRKASVLSTAYNFTSMPGDSAYKIYRLGMLMGNPDMENIKGPAAANAVVVAYTQEEEEKVHRAKKRSGDTSQMLSDRGSTEPTSTDTVSPVAKIKRNKYGI